MPRDRDDHPKRAISPKARDEDAVEESLRPRGFNEFTGQDDVKERLQICVAAARKRGEPCDHVLLSGPPGLGKTTLARIIANELGAQFHSTSAPAIERPGDLLGHLTSLGEGDILFIDEIHRLRPVVEEYLYPAMEDFFIDIAVDSGPGSRTVKFNLKRFTLIGATTRDGLLSRPFQDRFGIQQKLTFYTPEQLARIVERSARILGTRIDPAAAEVIARRSRRTPRIANRLLRRVRDWAIVRGDGSISKEIAEHALDREGVDARGLDEMDRNILGALARHGGGPVGLKTLAVMVGEEEDTVEEVYEPFLIQEGYILKTPKGRVLSDAGWKHLGLTPGRQRSASDGPTLFDR
ncbi:MAG: Holliday junction branch migration DNA helicase RuvB [Planctomycetota bacterium]|nr:Holliday junction branch migration DNA helicase RuvB [Planctomycetota bacterium]